MVKHADNCQVEVLDSNFLFYCLGQNKYVLKSKYKVLRLLGKIDLVVSGLRCVSFAEENQM